MPQQNVSIGIDLGGTRIKGVLLNQGMQMIGEHIVPTEAGGGPQHVLQRIGMAVDTLLKQAGRSREDLRCLGLGIPGLLDPEAGISRFSPNLGLVYTEFQ